VVDYFVDMGSINNHQLSFHNSIKMWQPKVVLFKALKNKQTSTKFKKNPQIFMFLHFLLELDKTKQNTKYIKINIKTQTNPTVIKFRI
jgi:hypothetical protein